MNFNFDFLFSAQKQNAIKCVYIFYSVQLTNTWPVSIFLSTHAWLQFSIKINPIFICCLLFTFQRRHKKYDNGTRSIHIYSFRFKISFDFLLQLSNWHGSVFQIWAATFQLVYCLHFFFKMVDLTYFLKCNIILCLVLNLFGSHELWKVYFYSKFINLKLFNI